MVHHELVKNVFLPRREDCFDYLPKGEMERNSKMSIPLLSDIWSDGFTLKGAKKYQYQRCYRYFNDLTGTVFDNHKFPLEGMSYIIKEMEAAYHIYLEHIRTLFPVFYLLQ